jgi:hypothetical protein
MNTRTAQRFLRGGIAAALACMMVVAFAGAAVAAPGGTRPGWGCGDTNHVHTGPPGLGASAVTPCGAHGPGAAAAVHFSISAPSTVSAGGAFNFTVTALNPGDQVLTGFGDTIHFTSSDAAASFANNDVTLSNGSGTFTGTLFTAGNQTITATDNSNANFTGMSNVISVAPLSATHLAVSAPATATHGTAFTFSVTAQDQFNNTATGFTDMVHFTSSDGSASLPADATLTNGSGTFTATLNSTGSQTITATDTSTSSINGMATIAVS